MTYGDSAADYSQLYEYGNAYIISVCSDPSSDENHYRVYFDWSLSNLWAPQVLHYIDFDKESFRFLTFCGHGNEFSPI